MFVLVAHDWFCPRILVLAILCCFCSCALPSGHSMFDGARINKQPTQFILEPTSREFGETIKRPTQPKYLNRNKESMLLTFTALIKFWEVMFVDFFQSANIKRRLWELSSF